MATAAQLPPIAGDPYLAARQEYSDRYANLAAGKRNWQVAALIFAILAGLASATALIQVRQVKLIPYVVVEDRLGQVVSVPDVLRPSAASIDLEAITRTTIEAFIHGIRSVYADPVAQYDTAQAAKSHLVGAANHYVGEWFEANNPFKIARTHTVEVIINTMQLLDNPRHIPGYAYQVRWTERYFDNQGRSTHEPDTHWQALVHAVSEPPSEDPLRNPGAVYIDKLQWVPETIPGVQK